MKRLILTAVFLYAVSTGFVMAATDNWLARQTAPDICPKVRTVEYTVYSEEAAAAKASNIGAQLVGSSNSNDLRVRCARCSNQKISFRRDAFSGVVIITPTHTCTTQYDLDTYGCKSWCPTCVIEPKISLVLPAARGGIVTTRSKCDPNIARDMRQSKGGDTTLTRAGQQQATEKPVSTGSSSLSPKIVEAFKNANVAPEKIAEAVKNPSKLQALREYAAAVEKNDASSVTAAAKDLGLSSAQTQKLATNAAALAPEARKGFSQGAIIEKTSPPSTFDEPNNASTEPHAAKVSVVAGPGPQSPFDMSQSDLTYGMIPRLGSYESSDGYAYTQSSQGSGSPFNMLGSLISSFLKRNTSGSSSAQQSQTSSSITLSNSQPNPNTSAATLLVQPKTAVRGGQLTISWSSVGMSQLEPCRILIGSEEIAKGNEGSAKKTIPLAASGELEVSLKCTSLDGPIERKERIPVE